MYHVLCSDAGCYSKRRQPAGVCSCPGCLPEKVSLLLVHLYDLLNNLFLFQVGVLSIAGWIEAAIMVFMLVQPNDLMLWKVI